MDSLRKQTRKVVETDGCRDSDSDKAETELRDVIEGEAREEQNEHQETLEVELPLEIGLDMIPLGPRTMERICLGMAQKNSPEWCLIQGCQKR